MKNVDMNDDEFYTDEGGKDRSKRKDRRERKAKDKKPKKRKCDGDCDNCLEPCEEYYLRQSEPD